VDIAIKMLSRQEVVGNFPTIDIKREEADLSEYNDCGFSQTDWTFHLNVFKEID
jgi:hypothetical protein